MTNCLIYIILILFIISLQFLAFWGIQLLWNWLIPLWINGPEISYWQSALCCILFEFICILLRVFYKKYFSYE